MEVGGERMERLENVGVRGLRLEVQVGGCWLEVGGWRLEFRG